jgi:hypothetical protein
MTNQFYERRFEPRGHRFHSGAIEYQVSSGRPRVRTIAHKIPSIGVATPLQLERKEKIG